MAWIQIWGRPKPWLGAPTPIAWSWYAWANMAPFAAELLSGSLRAGKKHGIVVQDTAAAGEGERAWYLIDRETAPALGWIWAHRASVWVIMEELYRIGIGSPPMADWLVADQSGAWFTAR